jgi:acyl-CoA thioester hydrolase
LGIQIPISFHQYHKITDPCNSSDNGDDEKDVVLLKLVNETMEYSKIYRVKDEHIDVQNIMDGLYYPFYMEYCRHDYIREKLGFDFEMEAKNGIYMVLSSYTINFVRSLKRNDEFQVTCEVFADEDGLPRLHFKQTIMFNKKLMTKAVFTGTCIPAAGGRPYLPDSVHDKIKDAPLYKLP